MAPSQSVGPGALALICAAGCAAVAGLVEHRGDLWGDTRALAELHDVAGRTSQDAFATIDDLTDLPGLTIAGVAAVLGLLLAGRVTSAAFFAVSVGGVWVVNPVLKELFERPRPDLWPTTVSVSEFSFPSGHAANTAALVVAFVLALPAGRWRLGTSVAGPVAVIVVAISQLALGVHYPSDILAGWLWAGAWVAGVRAITLCLSGGGSADEPRRCRNGARPTARA